MSERFEDDMMEDLMADSPESSHAMDEFDEGDEAEGFDEIESSMDDLGDDGFEEPMDSFDSEDAMDEMEEAVTDALEAEDADEFFGGLGRILKKVGRGIGSVARTVAPIASMIPIPQAQLIGRAAGLIGKVLADEADEMEAFDEMAEFAEAEEGFDALAPAIAGIAIRGVLKQQAARIPRVQRRALVKTVAHVTRHIAHKHGPRAIAAVPAIVEHARKLAIRKRIPARHFPELVARTARVAVRSPKVLRKLASAGARLRTSHGVHRHRRHGVAGYAGSGSYRTTGTMYGGRRSTRYGFGGVSSGVGAVATGCAHCRGRTYHLTGPVTLTITGR
jgi:hypothetical protein